MPRIELTLGVLLLTLVTPRSAISGDASTSTCLTNSQPLQAMVRSADSGEGSSSRSRALVTCRGSQMSWLLPMGYRMDQAGPHRVTLCSSDRKRFLQLRVVDAATPGSESLDVHSLRQFAKGKYPGGVVTGESARSVAGAVGTAFDLRWSIASQSLQAARVVFVSSPAGLLEITMVSLADDFAGALIDLNTVLVTFTSAPPGGLLDVEPLSEML